MFIDLLGGSAILYLAACAVFLRWAAGRGVAGIAPLAVFTVALGWTGAGAVAALLYALLSSSSTRPAPR